MNANSTQVGGMHYQGEYQTWDFIHDMKLGYFDGNVIKYLSRWRKKNGIEDLKKAQHYLAKHIELVEAEGLFVPARPVAWADLDSRGFTVYDAIDHYTRTNSLRGIEYEAVHMLAAWKYPSQLRTVAAMIAAMIRHTPVEDVATGPAYGPGTRTTAGD